MWTSSTTPVSPPTVARSCRPWRRIGFTPKLVVNPSNCADGNAYVAAGAAADGNVIPVYLKDPGDPAQASDAGVKLYLSQVTTANKNNTIAVAGWVQADLLINTLKQAAASPSGLTHVSVIQAARDQSYASPMLHQRHQVGQRPGLADRHQRFPDRRLGLGRQDVQARG